MGEENYRNITQGDFVRVYVPIYGKNHYFYIFGSVQYTGSVTRCFLTRHGTKKSGTERTVVDHVKLYTYAVAARAINSGLYVFNCSATYRSVIDSQIRTISRAKTMELLFVNG